MKAVYNVVTCFFFCLAQANAGAAAQEALLVNTQNLAALAQVSTVPTYERQPKYFICHIGVGAFHRSHQAVYLHELAKKHGHQEWGLCGIGVLASDRAMGEDLAAQDYLYSVLAEDSQHSQLDMIGSINAFVDAHGDPTQALARLADPSTRIVSLTITEKGYPLSKTGGLDTTHPGIVHDLGHPDAPQTAVGLIVKALKLRKDMGRKPFTVLSCDNLQHNGDLIRRLVVDYAQRVDGELAAWIEASVTFPSSMVDRITPAATPAHAQRLQDDYQLIDKRPVHSELWRQWIIEDHFSDGRPALEEVGVVFTDDVAPYEALKLRLLNASHSALGYLGLLQGHTYVDEAVTDPELRAFVRGFMDELGTTITGVDPAAVNNYADVVLGRFANTHIKDTLVRISQDGSTKYRQTLSKPLADKLSLGQPIPHIAMALAGWVRYVSEQSHTASSGLDDPKAALLQQYAAPSYEQGDELALGKFLQVVFAFDNPDYMVTLTSEVQEAVGALKRVGVSGALAQIKVSEL